MTVKKHIFRIGDIVSWWSDATPKVMTMGVVIKVQDDQGVSIFWLFSELLRDTEVVQCTTTHTYSDYYPRFKHYNHKDWRKNEKA